MRDVREKVAIDKSKSNKEAIVSLHADTGLVVAMPQARYQSIIVEQDHRAIRRITRPMLGFKTFRCARMLTAGIKTIHMIRKGQLAEIKDKLRLQQITPNHWHSDDRCRRRPRLPVNIWSAPRVRECLLLRDTTTCLI